jgi:hypothetical protein
MGTSEPVSRAMYGLPFEVHLILLYGGDIDSEESVVSSTIVANWRYSLLF